MQINSIQNTSASLASATTKTSKFAYYDPRDTNQDGVVSPAEIFAYDLKHPDLSKTANNTQTSAAAHQTPLIQYTQKGALNAGGKTANSLFDVYI